MSKAFVRENDEDERDDDEESSVSRIPFGEKNYMTPAGARRLQEELHRYKFIERPEVTKVVSWAAENGDRSENADYIYGKRRLREIDRKIRFLAKRLDKIEIIEPRKDGTDQVFFGATVRVLFEDDTERTYSIVGIDETNVEEGRISWISPLASALLRAHVGDVVMFQSPKGMREIEILEVSYEELP